ncbi:MAG: RNA polymerase sigma factor [Candidatus Fervidibacter sp.]
MELVRRAKAGDVKAFEELVHRYWSKTFRLAESIVGSTDAEDITIEAFVQAWQAVQKFREQSSFGTWLFRIVINQAKQWQRKRVTSHFEPLEGENGWDGAEVSLRGVEAIACERDWQRRVRAAVQKLPEQLRLPLVLRFWNELSYPEIAQLLGIKESTARMRVVAALKMLATMLGLPCKGGKKNELPRSQKKTCSHGLRESWTKPLGWQ